MGITARTDSFLNMTGCLTMGCVLQEKVRSATECSGFKTPSPY